MKLRVVVMEGCEACGVARELTKEIQRMAPRVTVELVELGKRPLPDGVVAAPTYLLDDKVVSLGNPRLGELLKQLGVDTDAVEVRGDEA